MVYEPREDSFLLAQVVEKHARGKTLDMGTGSGVQGVFAKKAGCSVLAADIDSQAVQKALSAGLEAVCSDLFANISEVFDTIMCNPPYLPDDPRAPDVALDGGSSGFEWTIQFLDQARAHLARDGQILLLISSLTNPFVIERWLLEHAFSWEIVSEQKLSFETLYVYRITWALPDKPKAVFVARGRRSRVYRDGKVAIKLADPRRVAQEAFMLDKVNALGIGPKLFKKEENRLYMEFVDGVRIDRFIDSSDSKNVSWVLRQVLVQCRALDKAGINKQEMTNPYKHVIVCGERVVLIDWERAKHVARTQNVAQFREYKKRLAKTYPNMQEVAS